MDLQLRDRRAIVTGSTLGIGYAIAKGLAFEGASVILNGRTVEGVARAVARLREQVPGGKIEGVVADVSLAEGAEALQAKAPTIDILVNNAGIFEPKNFFNITDEEWRRFFSVNVLSGVRLARLYARDMAARKWGRILFVSSESAIAIPREMIHYGVSKTAQLAVARGLAVEMAGTGVTVNSILPGPTRSEGVVEFIENLATTTDRSVEEVEEDFFRTIRPTSLVRRFAEPDEVADLAVYLCSPRAAMTTGAAMRVDGGVVNAII
jgi:NAD(P)-dependent dehydrogenase (short-subunit alcohol dehydrogenase family)